MCICSSGPRDHSGYHHTALATWAAGFKVRPPLPALFSRGLQQQAGSTASLAGESGIGGCEGGLVGRPLLLAPLSATANSLYAMRPLLPLLPLFSQGLPLVRNCTLTSAVLIRVASIKQLSVS